MNAKARRHFAVEICTLLVALSLVPCDAFARGTDVEAPRLSLPGPSVNDPAVQRLFAKVRSATGEPINIHQVLAYVPPVAEDFFNVTGGLRSASTLSRTDQELVILRTLTLVNGAYELPPHREFARLAGLTSAQIDNVASWRGATVYDRKQRALLGFIEQSLSRSGVDDRTFKGAATYFDKKQLVAAVLLSGMYSTLSQLTRTFEVPADTEAALRSARAASSNANQPRAAAGRYKFLVFLKPAEGREAEFNTWYDSVHFQDVLHIPGVRSGQRYVLADNNKKTVLNKYLVIYDVETDDITKVQRALAAAAGTPAMMISDSLDRASVVSGYYEPMGPLSFPVPR